MTPEKQGHGDTTEAVGVGEYAFDHRRQHKLIAQVFGLNDASIAVLERVGFDREGVHKSKS